jgi:streptogrisin C
MRSNTPFSRRRAVVTTLGAASLFAASCSPGQISEGVAPEVNNDVFQILQRDLGQSAADVQERLVAEDAAAKLAPSLSAQVGAPFAGAWMSDDGKQLLVGVTDASQVDAVRALGAEPVQVARSLAQLEAVKARLDDSAVGATVDPSIHAWYVDVKTNRVVVVAADPGAAAVAQFVDRVGAERAAVEVVQRSEAPRPLYDLRGGDEYILGGNTLCSVGFSVNGGFVTAGHCGKVGTTTQGSNWVAQGTVAGSKFPGNDWAYVTINSSWNNLPQVGDHNGGAVAVKGSSVATIGSSVCRSGRTTGWHCGSIQAYNVTVNYPQGAVNGLTQTNVCAEGGDSGGSFISGNNAQGVTSGGSGNCTSGGQTFFQPIGPILSTFGLTLKTDGGGSGGAVKIVGKQSGRCLDVNAAGNADGTKIQLYDCNGTAAQAFQLKDLGNGQYNLVNTNSNKCVDVSGSGTADGTLIQLWTCNGTNAQKFYFTDMGGGNYRIANVNSNKCADASGANTGNGTQILQWGCHTGDNQQWALFNN